MRNELQIIEQIERYLRDELSEEEKIAFEVKLKSSQSLQNEFDIQRSLLKGIERLGVKKDIQTAKRKYFYLRIGSYTSILLTIVIVSMIVYYFNIDEESSINEVSTVKVVSDEPISKNTKHLETRTDTASRIEQEGVVEAKYEKFELPKKKFQYFKINQKRDTTLKGQEGTVLEIKSNSFKTASNEITIRLKEYYEMSDMAFTNLTTMTTNNEILETGGVLFLEAISNDGEKLELQKDKKIRLKFPFKEKKSKMQLFTGEVNQDAIIQWNEVKEASASNQEVEISEPSFESEVYTIVEKMPKYPGCDGENNEAVKECSYNGVTNYIKENIKYSKELITSMVAGTVYISYIIDERGFVTNSRVLRGVDPLLDDEALRVINTLPRHVPGSQQGKAVPVQFTIPIKFNVDGVSKSYTTEEIKAYNDSVLKVRKKERSIKLGKRLELAESGIEEVSENTLHDIEYYVFASSNLGWINCDRFRYEQGEKTNFTLNDFANEAQVRIIFHRTKSLITGHWKNEKYHFSNLPIGEKVTIFAIKNINGLPYICLQETKISNNSPNLEFNKVSKNNIKDYSKKINSIHN